MRSPEGEEFDNTGFYLEIIPGEKLSWTSVLGADYRPAQAAPGDLAMTAIIELAPNDNGGTHYRAIAVHTDARKQHEDMGFHEGWDTVVDQLVEIAKGSSNKSRQRDAKGDEVVTRQAWQDGQRFMGSDRGHQPHPRSQLHLDGPARRT